MSSGITDVQRRLLDHWLGTWHIVDDYSWPLQDTTVLHVRTADQDCIVKAGAAGRHIPREIAAHQQFLQNVPDVAPRLLHQSSGDFLLVTRYLPGEIVEGSVAEWDPDTYRQAGALLARLLVPGERASDYSARLRRQCMFDLDNADGLLPESHVSELRSRVRSVAAKPVPVVFTHGDFSPRNWLIHDGRVSVIDFGRAEQRHWTSELFPLRNKQFVGRPDLEEAFFDGLGITLDDVDDHVWQLEQIHQSVSTVVWAHQHGDYRFEHAGRAMVRKIA